MLPFVTVPWYWSVICSNLSEGVAEKKLIRLINGPLTNGPAEGVNGSLSNGPAEIKNETFNGLAEGPIKNGSAKLVVEVTDGACHDENWFFMPYQSGHIGNISMVYHL